MSGAACAKVQMCAHTCATRALTHAHTHKHTMVYEWDSTHLIGEAETLTTRVKISHVSQAVRSASHGVGCSRRARAAIANAFAVVLVVPISLEYGEVIKKDDDDDG